MTITQAIVHIMGDIRDFSNDVSLQEQYARDKWGINIIYKDDDCILDINLDDVIVAAKKYISSLPNA